MGYWKSKVVPLFKKVFDKNATKKVGASEASKTFEDSKEGYAKEIEGKRSDLQTKVVEIFNALSVETKGLVKEPKEVGIKKQAGSVQKLLDELDKIDFPGSKLVREAAANFGPGLVPGPVIFILEKVSTFIVTEEPAAAVADAPPPAGETSGKTEEIKEKEKEIAVEPEKKEEASETVVTPVVEKESVPETVKVEETPAGEAKTVVEV